MTEFDAIGKAWSHLGIAQGHCKRPLPGRLQELLKAGNDNPQLFADLASCFETDTHYDYDYDTQKRTPNVTIIGADYLCLEPHQKSLGVSDFAAFLVRKILNGTNEPVTEEKLVALFSDPKTVKEYNKIIYLGDSYEDKLAHLVAQIILLLDGFVCREI